MSRLALDRWHRDHGAEMRTLRDREVAWRYVATATTSREPVSVSDLLRGERLGLLDRSGCGRLELIGEDRERFLSGLVTCRVAGLGAGECTYGYFTEGKGRILSDVLVIALEDRLWLELPSPTEANEIRAHLEKYIVADRVEVLPLGDFVQLALVGAGTHHALRSASELSAPGSDVDVARDHDATLGDGGVVRLGKTQLFVHRHPRLGTTAVQFWVSSGIASDVADDLLEHFAAQLIGHETAERVRLIAGVPRYGADFDSSNLPGEVAVRGAVDFEKGCYLGQEIVARMHYRGQPARQLRRLRARGTGPEVEELIAALDRGERELRLEGESVGEVTSWSVGAQASSGDELVALGLVRRAALEAPTLELSDVQFEILGPPSGLEELGARSTSSVSEPA